MSQHEAFRGYTCDHLYLRCPAVQRAIGAPEALRYPDLAAGTRLEGTVDPLGTDVCGWCRSVYIAKRMK